jgi:hypothetical protein
MTSTQQDERIQSYPARVARTLITLGHCATQEEADALAARYTGIIAICAESGHLVSVCVHLMTETPAAPRG